MIGTCERCGKKETKLIKHHLAYKIKYVQCTLKPEIALIIKDYFHRDFDVVSIIIGGYEIQWVCKYCHYRIHQEYIVD